MDIVVTGYAGYEGSRLIYANKDYRDKLLKRYSASFFGVFENADYSCHVAENMTSAYQANDGTSGSCQTSKEMDRLYRTANVDGLASDGADGGVLAALWNVLKAHNTGARYSLGLIPVLQQTIEVCEMFGLNPYRLHSPGCRVWLAEDSAALRYEADAAGVPWGVIGFTYKGVAIKRMDTAADSSLRRPEADELTKILCYPLTNFFTSSAGVSPNITI